MYIEERPSKKFKKGVSYTVKFYYKDELGNKKRYSKGGFQTKKEAQVHGAQALAMIQEKGSLKKECSKTICDCFQEYMKLNEDKYAPNTLENYKSLYKVHVKPSRVANIPISRLNYQILQAHFNTLKDQGKTIVLGQKKVFSLAIKHAIKCGYIERNPLVAVEAKYKVSDHQTHVITPKELERIVDLIIKNEIKTKFISYSYCIGIYIGYYTGLRVTELLALEKEDFDLEKGELNVSKKLENIFSKRSDIYLTQKMKTKNSHAILPLPDSLISILKCWFSYNPYTLVVCNENGQFILPATFRYVLKKVGKELGIDLHPHCLRHTYITNIVHSGTDIKTASELARHSNINTTLNVYTHSNEKRKKEAISSAFEQKSPRKAPI